MHTTQPQIAEARTIVANPADHSPLARSQAWAALKESRGQPVDYRHTPRLFPRPGAPEPPLGDVLAMAHPAVTARIRARARQLGLSGPEGAA